jgi:hypothetical protein
LATSLLAVAAMAEEAEQRSSSSTVDVAAAPPLYQLPKVGKPTGRVGGGRRGAVADLPDIYTLVPDHVGYTMSGSPTLYWYLSERATGPVKFELTLIDEKSIDPLVDRQFAAPATPGLQRIRLADFGVTLEPGEEYQWSISVVPDAEDRSKDLVSSGWIERVPEPEGFSERLAAAGPSGAAAVYGAEGLWYDLLAVTCEKLAQHPDDAGSRAQLAGLLAQVGLPESAAR